MESDEKVGRCEVCGTNIYADEKYLKTDFEDLLCNSDCLEEYLVRDRVVFRINKD